MAHLHIVERAGKSLHVGRFIDLERRLRNIERERAPDHTQASPSRAVDLMEDHPDH
jgi:hypothetical protein